MKKYSKNQPISPSGWPYKFYSIYLFTIIIDNNNNNRHISLKYTKHDLVDICKSKAKNPHRNGPTGPFCGPTALSQPGYTQWKQKLKKSESNKTSLIWETAPHLWLGTLPKGFPLVWL